MCCRCVVWLCCCVALWLWPWRRCGCGVRAPSAPHVHRTHKAWQRSRFPAEGEHKLDSLPVLSMSALELSNIQPPGALSRLSADLQRYQRHLEWLRRAGPALRPLEAELGALHARLERLLRRLDHLLSRLSLSRPNDPHPALPPPGSPWAAVQAAHAVLRGLHLHLDWASRALVLLRNRL